MFLEATAEVAEAAIKEAAIAILPENLVARIAAGEAVERPASAVKELIENAIDAAATSIHIEVAAGGKKLIRVIDNGSGIPKDQITLAFRRHATSKLRAGDDLQSLSTLGFRGEALASIAAVSQATIHTRHRGENMGVTLRLSGGEILHQRSIGAAAGSVISIENLFFNTPARLKFLKRDLTEKRQVHSVVTRYALAYPGIAFALIQDGREQFRSSGNGELPDVAARVFGGSAFARMAAVAGDNTHRRDQAPMAVRGFTSLPSLTRKDRTRIILFVNGRAIRDSSLTHAVTQAYDGLIPSGTFPLAALMLTMPPDVVDVNVHPTKAELRFRDGHQVFSLLQRALRKALLESEPEAAAIDLWSAAGFSHDRIDPLGPASRFRPWAGAGPYEDIDLAQIPATAEAPGKPRTLPVLRVVGQVGASYIVAEGPAGLYLVDQNAAHERVLYQQISDELEAGGAISQELAESQTVMLSPADINCLRGRSPHFDALGFVMEAFGPNTLVLRALPKAIAQLPAGDSLPLILERLSQGGGELEDLIRAVAAAGAVKSGQILQEEEMRSLAAQLERCPSPLRSPSGRATLIHLTRERLAQEFRRG